MIKEFFKEHDHLRFSLQHLNIYGGGWKIEVYNTRHDIGIEPNFVHYILDKDLESLNVDFETAIMIPVINWKNDMDKRKVVMNELENILTEASIEEIDWLCKYDITDRSSDIAIAALKYVRKLKEMDGDEND